MDPKIWGRGGWHIIHRFAHNGKAHFKTIQDAKTFYESFIYILPCQECRKNYKKHFNELSFPKTLMGLPKWAYELHNLVNENLGGHHVINVPSFHEVSQTYSSGSNITDGEKKFLHAIAKTHPGKWLVTPEYIEALRIFTNVLLNLQQSIDHSVISTRTQYRVFIDSSVKSNATI